MSYKGKLRVSFVRIWASDTKEDNKEIKDIQVHNIKRTSFSAKGTRQNNFVDTGK